MVNPPSEDNLPGEDEVLYRSQVQDVLIPYTTKEDTYNYYETRNYVNDVNRDHTQVLQTYDDQLQKRETYVYGNGRATYTNESTGDSYNYLTSQSGSVTGLTQNGNSVASSSYNLYGATKQTTDTTGNPFAYNGEARDVTGLDYLRARYYDSQAGTFLTADSYPGSQTDPLSQNLYAYVQNNPANYTDPSGHIWKTLTNAYNTAKKAVSKAYNTIKSAVGHAVNWVGQKVNQAVNWAGNAVRQTTNWIGQQWNNFQTSAYQAGRSIYNSASQYVSHQYQQAKQTVSNAWEQAKAMGQSVYNWGVSKSREAMNIARSWTKSLEETFRHSCETASFANGGTTVYASEIAFTSGQNTVAQDFKNNLQKKYGFDSQTADIMWMLYDNIKKAEGKNADYLFNRIMGGVQYDGFKWDNTAGGMGEVKNVLNQYGVSGSDADKLIYNIRIQYLLSSGNYGAVSTLSPTDYKVFKSTANKVYPGVDFDTLWDSNYSKYSDKADFAHQSITTATHLYDKPRLADIYGILVGGTASLAGWRGDVTKDAEASPSMGNDDYRADLDTVNITSIMQKNKIDYISASNMYYDGIASGTYNRANTFKQNVSLDDVKKQYTQV
ncbi:RHS repeat-associated core domain-containing protein [Streptococcus suis]